ncbi:MAG: 6-carboxytetrahydropterin synthase QueD [Candidatus Peregrinibacteria bacterium]
MPKFTLNKVFHFSSAHFLTKYKGKCENLHGHNYKLIVTIEDDLKDDGMALDYKEIKDITNKEVIEELDHISLNDIIENPSSENLCIWIWDKLSPKLPLKKITLYETENSFCEYSGKA